jgi:glycosyl-4,4'-diaponeurosporenoate acyltransferase
MSATGHVWTPVLASAAGWFGWSLLIGALANRLSQDALRRDNRLTRLRPWETRRRYEQGLAIRFWIRVLPDAGQALPGGVAKSALVRRDSQALESLMAETRRAEWVHWALWPFWLVTGLWLPPIGVLANLLFATLFNLPCLAVQRYNRRRLQSSLARCGETGR